MDGNPRKQQLWVLVINKTRSKLNARKNRYLILSSRVCLIKSIFSAIPLFHLSFITTLISFRGGGMKKGKLYELARMVCESIRGKEVLYQRY